jgi:hypothetical protein
MSHRSWGLPRSLLPACEWPRDLQIRALNPHFTVPEATNALVLPNPDRDGGGLGTAETQAWRYTLAALYLERLDLNGRCKLCLRRENLGSPIRIWLSVSGGFYRAI